MSALSQMLVVPGQTQLQGYWAAASHPHPQTVNVSCCPLWGELPQADYTPLFPTADD